MVKRFHGETGWVVFVLVTSAAGWGCTTPQSDARSAQHHHGPREGSLRPPDGHGMHRRFEDAGFWAKRFENPGRDGWQDPDHILEVLDLAPDAKVADIGSATGYFPVRFAQAAPEGKVYGLDIEQDMVRYLNERAERDGLTNLESIQAAMDDPRIPEPVDLIFVCNTYHHISDRAAYFRMCLADLRPGGRLAIVDFKQGDFPVGPSNEHKIPPEQVVSELAEAGYRLIHKDDDLPYQFFYIFAPVGQE